MNPKIRFTYTLTHTNSAVIYSSKQEQRTLLTREDLTLEASVPLSSQLAQGLPTLRCIKEWVCIISAFFEFSHLKYTSDTG